jgi:tyrosinase
MLQGKLSRRTFMGHSALALGVSAFPFELFAATTLTTRPEWQTFKTTTQYDSLLRAFTLMKSNTNSADPNSWTYWVNIHLNNCPHGVPYFLAWHRGYIYYFERQIRAVSGDSKLVLPYWDYYSYATMPAEFTNSSNSNPLYVDRVNTNVRQALTMAPFASTIINFPTGMSNAFEPTCEGAPHNQIHNLIGNVMATMQSPIDPIFWLHHANIDRLWVAWVSAGGGRKMPQLTSSYWSGSHIYTSTLSIARTSTYDTRKVLGYRYYNETLPTALPVAKVDNPNIRRVQATPGDIFGSIPAVGSFQISGPRQTSNQTFSVGGALNVGLDERSISVQLPMSTENALVLKKIAAGRSASFPGLTNAYRSVRIVLDDIEVSDAGKQGGYFYQLYLNIPSAYGLSTTLRSVYIGTLGPFEVNAAMHHGGHHVQLNRGITHALSDASARALSMMSISFVRVSGDRSPKGAAIGIGEVRVEASIENSD